MKPIETTQATELPISPVPHIPIEKVLRHIGEISTLPHVAMRVMELANDPDSTAQDLKDAVESDPSLSARVLKCVNSAAYAMRSTITNLQQAISYVGFNQVRNLAITGSVSESFKKEVVLGQYKRSALWHHMISVGICARLIAMRCKLQNFEDAFLAGLLHDIGIILEDQYVHEPFSIMISSLSTGKTLVDSEREYLGFDHTTLGTRVAESWKFPPAVQAAIRFHHMSENYRGDDGAIVQCVEVANLICTLKDISSVGLKLVRLPQAALNALSLQKEDIRVLVADLDHEFSLYEDIFRM